jgi:hypothetical protein
MARNFLTNLNLLQNELQNARVQNLSTPPSSPVAGQIYFNTGDASFYYHNGTSWQKIATGGSSITLGGTTITVGSTVTSIADLTLTGTSTWSGNTITVAKGGTGTTNGSITGTGALTFTAGGTNQNVILVPSGTGSVNVSSARIINVADPVNNGDAANKLYVDNKVAGVTWKQAVNLLATANVPLTGNTSTVTIDGHPTLTSTHSGYRLLLTGQTAGAENGVYDYTDNGTTYTLTRSSDANTYTELKGATFFVMEGTSYQNTSWTQSNTYLTDFTGQTWVQFSGASSVTAGAGMVANGNAFDIVGTSNRILVNTNSIDIDSNYVGQSSITTVSSTTGITTGAWKATIIDPTYGGTGVNNGSKTITLGGSLTTSGAYTTTLTSTANTSVTLPTTGTLATLTGTETFSGKKITLAAGTATTGTAPLYFTSGTNLTTATAGAMEFDGTNLYFTPATSRKTVAFTDSNITGSAATLSTARTLWGFSFDGSASTSATSITDVGTNITGAGALTIAAGGTNQSLNLQSSGSASINIGTTSTGAVNIGNVSGSTATINANGGITLQSSGASTFTFRNTTASTAVTLTGMPTSLTSASASVTLKTGSQTGSASTGDLILKSGDNTGTGNAGNVNVDSGTVVSGTTGAVNIGVTNASAVTIGRSATTTTINGTLVASAPAGSLTGTTLASGVVNSSLTKIGALSSGTAGFVKVDASGNLTSDGSTYLTSSSAVTSITGTANQVTASASTGAVTLSLPQDIATTSTPTFAGLTVGTSNITGSGALTVASAAASALSLKSGTTGSVTIDNGTSGSNRIINVGTTAAGIVNIGNYTNTATVRIVHSVSGAVVFGAAAGSTAGGLLRTEDLSSGVSGEPLTIRTGNITNAAVSGSGDLTLASGTSNLTSGSVSLKSGNATGNSGTVTIDAGTSGATVGTVRVGYTNATGIYVGNASSTTFITGAVKLPTVANSTGGFVKTQTDGTLVLDGSTYLTSSTGVTSINGTSGAITGVAKKTTGTNTAGTSWSVNHGFGQWVTAQVFETATGYQVELDVVNASTGGGTTTFTSASSLTAGAYTYVIIG